MIHIVCPLQFERTRIRQALKCAGVKATIECSGPGATAIAQWASNSGIPAGSAVLLVGTAGSVSADHAAGEAFGIESVVDAANGRWHAELRATGCRLATVACVPNVVIDPAERKRIAQTTCAHLIDLESGAFAHAAVQRGWRWGIVRGVSDDASTPLMADPSRWIDARGRTRLGPVLVELLRRPALVRELRCLGDNSRRALNRAADIVAAIANEKPTSSTNSAET